MIKNKISRAAVILAMAFGLAFGAGAAYAAPSFVNGGFEADNWQVGSTDHVSPITGWTVSQSGDSRFVQGEHNTGSTTNNYTPFGSQFIELCAGDCAPGNNPPLGYVSQTVSGFVPGALYTLNFEHSPEWCNENDLIRVQIDGGGSISNQFNAYSSNCVGWADWIHQSWTFTAKSSTLTFTFSGDYNNGDPDIDGNWESGIDNITLADAGGAPIPTLSQWGMILLSGLLALGAVFTLRRRYL